MYGRQVFSHENPEAMVSALKMIVHNGSEVSEAMKKWIVRAWKFGLNPVAVPGVDRVVDEDLIIDGNAIYIEGKQVGRRVDVSNSSGQATARSMAGSVSWILLDLGEWKMIPIENIIAACDGGPTKVAARISSPEQVLGAAFALEIGVDALLVPSDMKRL